MAVSSLNDLSGKWKNYLPVFRIFGCILTGIFLNNKKHIAIGVLIICLNILTGAK